MHFALSIDSSVFRVVEETKQNLLEFFSKVAALSGAIASIAVFLMHKLEKLVDCCAKRKKKQEQPKTQEQEMQNTVMAE